MMKPQEFEVELRKTLEDQRLSRGERKALQQLVAGADTDHIAVLRSIAFKVARGELGDEKRTRQVMTWLEEVVKVLVGASADDAAPDSAALFSPGEAPLRRIVGLLGAAQNTADICVFTITDDRIAQGILDCHRRGVAVRIISDNDKSFDRGSDVQRLHEAGIKVRIDFSEAHMHHKFAVFDSRTLLTGSYNWTRSAAEYNHENVVVTNDTRLAGAFSDAFERIWHELER
jgi:phosphatidylserine/phosphatidylglycerophosphate/cardiolipin synthase-like enzyme